MARRLTLYPATLPISTEEEEIRQGFIAAYTKDYGPFTASDQYLLELASVELIKAVRLQEHELTTRNIITAARQHPIGTLTRLLEAMSATRAARMRGKQPDSEAELTMKDFLLSISDTPARSNGHVSN